MQLQPFHIAAVYLHVKNVRYLPLLYLRCIITKLLITFLAAYIARLNGDVKNARTDATHSIIHIFTVYAMRQRRQRRQQQRRHTHQHIEFKHKSFTGIF